MRTGERSLISSVIQADAKMTLNNDAIIDLENISDIRVASPQLGAHRHVHQRAVREISEGGAACQQEAKDPRHPCPLLRLLPARHGTPVRVTSCAIFTAGNVKPHVQGLRLLAL